jgi:hypothetical protein
MIVSMRFKTKVLVLILLAAAVVLACPIAPGCPLHDGSTGYFVRYEFIDGKQFGIYHCSRGEEFLVRCN